MSENKRCSQAFLALFAILAFCDGKKTLLKRIDFTKGDNFIQKSVVVILTENTPMASFGGPTVEDNGGDDGGNGWVSIISTTGNN